MAFALTARTQPTANDYWEEILKRLKETSFNVKTTTLDFHATASANDNQYDTYYLKNLWSPSIKAALGGMVTTAAIAGIAKFALSTALTTSGLGVLAGLSGAAVSVGMSARKDWDRKQSFRKNLTNTFTNSATWRKAGTSALLASLGGLGGGVELIQDAFASTISVADAAQTGDTIYIDKETRDIPIPTPASNQVFNMDSAHADAAEIREALAQADTGLFTPEEATSSNTTAKIPLTPAQQIEANELLRQIGEATPKPSGNTADIDVPVARLPLNPEAGGEVVDLSPITREDISTDNVKPTVSNESLLPPAQAKLPSDQELDAIMQGMNDNTVLADAAEISDNLIAQTEAVNEPLAQANTSSAMTEDEGKRFGTFKIEVPENIAPDALTHNTFDEVAIVDNDIEVENTPITGGQEVSLASLAEEQESAQNVPASTPEPAPEQPKTELAQNFTEQTTEQANAVPDVASTTMELEGGFTTYEIASKDTLYTIAQQAASDAGLDDIANNHGYMLQYVDMIAMANDLEDASNIRAGDDLILPEFNTINRSEYLNMPNRFASLGMSPP